MPISQMRNIGVIAHIDAGKTTTTERILFYTGKIHRMGEVDQGSAQMDWMPQEQLRGITITSAATTCIWKDHTINIIDTPGHVDFTAEVERSLRVLDGAVAVFCAVAGVQPQSEKVWRQAEKYLVPRLVFINKMDRIGADHHKVLEGLRAVLGAVPLPVQMPVGSESNFAGIIDLVNMVNLYWADPEGEKIEKTEIPDEYLDAALRSRDKLLETLSEHDDRIMALYLEEKEVPAVLVQEAIRKGTINGSFVPVLCGSSLKKKGVQPLLDAIVGYLPSPEDLPPVKGKWKDQPEVRLPEVDQPFSALLFKVMAYAGRPTLYYLRIYSGRCALGDRMLNTRTQKAERAMKIMRMHANRREEIREMAAGDILALVGLKNAKTGDTFCDPESPISFEEPVFPQPVIFVSIEPKSVRDQEKLMSVLDVLAEEDPTFQVRVDEETGQVILSGMGELHLDVLSERLFTEFNVQGKVGNPQVSYRETVTKTVSVTERFAREIAGKDQEATVTLQVQPLLMGGAVQFEDQVADGKIPPEMKRIIEQAALEAASSGVKAGYPVIDMKILLLDGEYHPDRSTDVAFKAATSNALNQCLRDAGPVLLEPVMAVQVETPDDFTGDVMGSLTHRRGIIEGVENQGHVEVISGKVPLLEMFGYTTSLRSMTQGRGSFTMELAHYREVEG
ncbi:MAG: elongation factor G [bacterium]|nr:elongation factor G [bacterium]MDT8365768.1 elongation factor G [bacterium]